jgi:hypothetical protein
VLGDSYSLGIGVAGPEVAWPAALGERLGAEVVLGGVGGTGFTTRGFCPENPVLYGERVDADPPDAEVVVVHWDGAPDDAWLSGDGGQTELVTQLVARGWTWRIHHQDDGFLLDVVTRGSA